MWQVFGRGLVVCAALVLAASFAGDLHGVGDSLAVFRPVILVGCLVVSALVWRWRVAQGVVFAVGLAALWHWGDGVFYDGPKEGADIVVYQKNMLFRERDRAPLEADLRYVTADVVTLQEVSRVNLPMLERLRDLYPFQLVCNAHSVGGVAVLSQTPLAQEGCARRAGMARAITQVRGRDVQVISVHLHWPWPYEQRAHALDLVSEISPLPNGETVIGGDFNMVSSGRSVAWFEAATGTARVGPNVRTYDFFGYPLGIDHVLATGGIGALTLRPRLGSDHFGVVAWVKWP